MSLFEGEGYPLPLKPELKVLILGEGPLSKKAAQAAVWAGGEPVRPRGELIGFTGWPGNFRAVVKTDQGATVLPLGAVVLALEDEPGGALAPAGGTALSLAQVNPEEDWSGTKTAILSGFWNQAGPGSFGRVLALGLKILEEGGTPFLFAPQAKVAGPGLEADYRRLREQGGLVTRIEAMPRMENEGERVRLTFEDPILDQEATVAVDRVIWDPPPKAPACLESLGAVLCLDQGPDGRPNPDNVLFPAPLTSRAGVFSLSGGGGAEPVEPEQETLLLSDHLRRLFNPQGGMRSAARTAAEKSQCALCLTCLRTCPVQAISWDHGPVVMEAACLNCGQCAAACPAAIIKPLWPEEEALKTLMAEPGQGDLVLACGRINEEILDGLPREAKAVRLSCAGRVGREQLFRLLSLGYQRIVVAACHPGNCRSLSGSERAGTTVRAARAELKELGIDPGIVSYVPLAPHQGKRLYGALGLGGD